MQGTKQSPVFQHNNQVMVYHQYILCIAHCYANCTTMATFSHSYQQNLSRSTQYSTESKTFCSISLNKQVHIHSTDIGQHWGGRRSGFRLRAYQCGHGQQLVTPQPPGQFCMRCSCGIQSFSQTYYKYDHAQFNNISHQLYIGYSPSMYMSLQTKYSNIYYIYSHFLATAILERLLYKNTSVIHMFVTTDVGTLPL